MTKKVYVLTFVSIYEGEEVTSAMLFSTKAKALKKFREEKKYIKYDFKDLGVEYDEDTSELSYSIYERGNFSDNHFTMEIKHLEIN